MEQRGRGGKEEGKEGSRRKRTVMKRNGRIFFCLLKCR